MKNAKEIMADLAKKAGTANDGAEALRYSQAALNLAHAMATIQATEQEAAK